MSLQKNLQLWLDNHNKLGRLLRKLPRHLLPSHLCLLAWDRPHDLRHRIRTLQNSRALLLRPRKPPRMHLPCQTDHKPGHPCLQFQGNLLRSLIGCHATIQLLPCRPKLGARMRKIREYLALKNSIRLVTCRLSGRQWLRNLDI
jgi:hypothetical protein